MKGQRHLITTLLMASGMALVALPAMADRGDCGPMGGWEKFQGQRGERMQQHQQKLHDALKLTPDQEAAWKKFTESMQSTARPERPDPSTWAKLTTPERAEKMLEFSKQRQDRMAEHVAALKTFYAVLTPEQKKVFDDSHPGPRGARHNPPQPGGGAAPSAAPGAASSGPAKG